MQPSIFISSSMLFAFLMLQTGNTSKSLPDAKPAKTVPQPSATYLDEANPTKGNRAAAAQPAPLSPIEQVQHDDPPLPLSGVVELLDGASSAKSALNAMVSASNAGDDQAVMLLIDPAIRPILRPNVAVERFAVDSSILERGLFGEKQFNVGGMLFWFTLRDLVRIRSVKLLSKRVVDDKRVVFTVLTTEKSYHEDEHIHTVRHFLAIQRSGRWYLFRPFGMLASLLEGTIPTVDPKEKVPLLRVHRSSDERTNREDAEYEVEYLLPIELIHEHLVQAANDPKIKEYNQIAEKLRRCYDSIVSRAKRGDYRSRSELNAAIAPLEDWAETLTLTTGSCSPGLQKLAQQHSLQTEPPEKQ